VLESTIDMIDVKVKPGIGLISKPAYVDGEKLTFGSIISLPNTLVWYVSTTEYLLKPTKTGG
jgi:hypothetical protein